MRTEEYKEAGVNRSEYDQKYEHTANQSRIASAGHGTAELQTENLTLRRYVPEDAEVLYKRLGSDPGMVQYSGWNPYATLDMAKQTVQRFICSYEDSHSYSWVMDSDGTAVGTIGAYDCQNDQIEVGFSTVKEWQGRGFATEALKAVLRYLTEKEGFSCVVAWCAEENTGSRRVLEKSGMRLAESLKGGLTVGSRVYDKRIYEYRKADH